MAADLVAERLGLTAETIVDERLTITATFRQRRRGVERKLIIGDTNTAPDDTLIRNVALAHAWFGELRAGRSYGAIAGRAGVSKRRVMQVVDLAILAPDLTAAILDGRQPVGLGSDRLLKQSIPSDFEDQRRMFAAMG